MDTMKGRTVLVTGANTGIGRVTAEVLAARGATLVLAGRSEARTRPVLDAIAAAGGKASFLELDLGRLSSVRDAAERFLATSAPLHVLLNSAAAASARGVTADGFELTFGTNHLGPYLFTRLLLPRLRESGKARIVNVSSRAHLSAKRIDWDALRRPTAHLTGLPEYAVSKLCNVLFTRSLAAGKAGGGITSYALHPGAVATDVWREVPFPFRGIMKRFMRTPEEGARTQIRCASDPALEGQDGLYWVDEAPARTNRAARDDALRDELWEKSAAWVGLPS